MEVIYAPKTFADLAYWKKSGNKAVWKKIQQLITTVQKSLIEGIGKPDLLKHRLTGEVVSKNQPGAPHHIHGVRPRPYSNS